MRPGRSDCRCRLLGAKRVAQLEQPGPTHGALTRTRSRRSNAHHPRQNAHFHHYAGRTFDGALWSAQLQTKSPKRYEAGPTGTERSLSCSHSPPDGTNAGAAKYDAILLDAVTHGLVAQNWASRRRTHWHRPVQLTSRLFTRDRLSIGRIIPSSHRLERHVAAHTFCARVTVGLRACPALNRDSPLRVFGRQIRVLVVILKQSTLSRQPAR